jgi:hypothetical protein
MANWGKARKITSRLAILTVCLGCLIMLLLLVAWLQDFNTVTIFRACAQGKQDTATAQKQLADIASSAGPTEWEAWRRAAATTSANRARTANSNPGLAVIWNYCQTANSRP